MLACLQRLHALVDGVLVRAGKGGVDQFADIGMALRDLQLVRIFVDVLHPVDVGAVELGIDALRVHVERQRHDVDIAGALAIAEQRAFDAVRARHQAEFGGGDAGAAVVVRMQRDEQVVAVVEVAAHPFDLVGIDVGRRHLDGRRQVDDQLVLRRRLDDLGDGVADLQRHFELGAGEALRRIFEAVAAAGLGRHVGDHLGGIGGDLLDAGDVLVEDDAALQFAGRIVEMHDRVGARPRSASKVRVISSGRHCTSTCSETSSGTLPSSMHQRAKSKSVCEADGKPISISLKPMSSSRLEHARLALVAHRIDQRLVAVAQVDRAPDRRLVDAL